MNDKVRAFYLAIREAITVFLGGLEDYLEIPYDKSVLARRRQKAREGSVG